MMDSDDDGDRRRDKFARERRDDDSYRRSGGGGYSRYDNKRPAGRRDDYQTKRIRGDDTDDTFEPVNRGDRSGNGTDLTTDSDSVYSGPLLTFKKFLGNQEDDISEEEAIKKYNEYKSEHRKHQLERFFRAHKDEEWFRLKYKPEDAKKQKDAQLENVQKRLQVFNEMKEQGQFDKFTLDFGDAEAIIRMLDSVVVKLENGTDDELKAVLAQKLDDESLADVKKENNPTEKNEDKASIKEEIAPKEELEEGAIDDGNDKSSNKVNIHKTCSVFLRNIPPGLTYEELENLCKRSPGFLRLALTDGIAERRFYRRGWATFKRDVNIKEICWALNAHRLRETDLNAIINRDITRRVRTNNGIAAHKQVAINDLKLAVKLTALYDKKVGLFNAADESDTDRDMDIRMGVDLISTSTNPSIKEVKSLVPNDILNDISEEEAELLGASNGGATQAEKVRFERDDNILKALDMLIVYLRIVHSIDFYNHGHYAQEDSMPNRCGLIHVRGQPPSGASITTDDDGTLVVPQKFINDFISGFNSRIEKGLIEKQYVSEEELEKMGKKDGEKEVEALIVKNTVELAKDKWLCPLSGKKFKGPEFIRKHLQSKHEDKLEEARAEAVFFNNYLADAQRPVDIEPKHAPREELRGSGDRGSYGRERDDDRPVGGRNSFGNGGGYDRRPQFPPRHSLGGRGGRYFDDGPRRQPVSYRDLDAPDDIP
uniref:Serrate RNA effector molecule homolog n=2 Tax=Caenorhabditis tropicalis TaxID=1561998 RepID=A0A1I7TK41_9PELO